MLTDQHRRGFKVDALVFDAHQNHPERVFPADRQREVGLADNFVHHGPRLAPVVRHLGHGRPVVVGVIQVIPAHLVHTDGEHGFELRVDALGDQAGQQQFVDEKSGSVAEVKNQRVA